MEIFYWAIPIAVVAFVINRYAWKRSDPPGLGVLNDEFNVPPSLNKKWLDINVTEGWVDSNGEVLNQLETFGIHAGNFEMMPYTCVWFQDKKGPLYYKEVTGNFIFTSSVEISNRAGNGLPSSNYSLAGIMIRKPKDLVNGSIGWATDGIGTENYVFLSIGRADSAMCDGCLMPHLEVKNTEPSSTDPPTPSLSALAIYSVNSSSATLRLARIGNAVIVLSKLPGGIYEVRGRFAKSDFPETLQVGMVSYTDWPHANLSSDSYHNSHILTGSSYNPDLLAKFSYARFKEVNLPENLVGVDLVNDATDEQLLSFLGLE